MSRPLFLFAFLLVSTCLNAAELRSACTYNKLSRYVYMLQPTHVKKIDAQKPILCELGWSTNNGERGNRAYYANYERYFCRNKLVEVISLFESQGWKCSPTSQELSPQQNQIVKIEEPARDVASKTSVELTSEVHNLGPVITLSVLPTLTFSSVNLTDHATGSEATLKSDAMLGVALQTEIPLFKSTSLVGSFRIRKNRINDSPGRPIAGGQRGMLEGEMGTKIQIFENERFYFKPSIGVQDEFYIKSVNVTDFDGFKVLNPFARLNFGTVLFESHGITINPELSAFGVIPHTTNNITIKGGVGIMPSLVGTYLTKNYHFIGTLSYLYLPVDTSLYQTKKHEFTARLGVGFNL